MTPAFTRTVFFTPVLNRVEIKWDGKRLSIVGHVRGGGGQCYDAILAKYPRPTVRLLVAFWKEWHLNDMKAGCPIQRDFLKANPVDSKGGSWYDKACYALKAAGLYEVDGYAFGTEWKTVEVPDYVLEWLRDANI